MSTRKIVSIILSSCKWFPVRHQPRLNPDEVAITHQKHFKTFQKTKWKLWLHKNKLFDYCPIGKYAEFYLVWLFEGRDLQMLWDTNMSRRVQQESVNCFPMQSYNPLITNSSCDIVQRKSQLLSRQLESSSSKSLRFKDENVLELAISLLLLRSRQHSVVPAN